MNLAKAIDRKGRLDRTKDETTKSILKMISDSINDKTRDFVGRPNNQETYELINRRLVQGISLPPGIAVEVTRPANALERLYIDLTLD